MSGRRGAAVSPRTPRPPTRARGLTAARPRALCVREIDPEWMLAERISRSISSPDWDSMFEPFPSIRLIASMEASLTSDGAKS